MVITSHEVVYLLHKAERRASRRPMALLVISSQVDSPDFFLLPANSCRTLEERGSAWREQESILMTYSSNNSSDETQSRSDNLAVARVLITVKHPLVSVSTHNMVIQVH